MEIFESNPIYPGTPLSEGSSGESVLTMQKFLNVASTRYTALIKLSEDGEFGTQTKHSTVLFQEQFSLNPDGVIGEKTWNKIVDAANAVTVNKEYYVDTEYPGYILSIGSQGDYVRFIQSYLSTILDNSTTEIDGIFGSQTEVLVTLFQSENNLTVDGKVGENTFTEMVKKFNKI